MEIVRPMSTPASEPGTAGRPIYFIRPHSVIVRSLVHHLIAAEYEVGLVKDHRRTEGLLRLHPDAIAYLNIDEGLAEEEWIETIARIRRDPLLERVRLGVVTYNPDPGLARRYLLDLELPAGFVKLSLDLEVSTQTILKVLQANEARGQRRFLRVNCLEESTEVTVEAGGTKASGRVVDLSVAGMACILTRDPGWPARAVVSEIRLLLRGNRVSSSGVFMGTRQEASGPRLHIFLFNPKDLEPQLDRVRTFLQDTVQHRLDQELKALEAPAVLG